MSFSHKHARIIKLHKAHLTPEQIARKIGHNGPRGVARVEKALAEEGLAPNVVAPREDEACASK